MLDAKNAISILINILFVATFLTIFFFTYVASVEEQIAKNQVQFVVNDFTSFTGYIPSSSVEELKYMAESVQLPDLTIEDQKVAKTNFAILKTAVMYVAILLGVGFAVSYYVAKSYSFSLLDVCKENLIILAFIGLTEYCFLTFFVSKYISANPNITKLAILNKLAKH